MTDGNMPNLAEMFQAAQRVQQEMERVKDELAQKTVEGAAGGGMVVAKANGQQRLIGIRIERDIVDPDDIDMLQDLVVAAVNQALTKAGELAQQELASITNGLPMQIPEGMF